MGSCWEQISLGEDTSRPNPDFLPSWLGGGVHASCLQTSHATPETPHLVSTEICPCPLPTKLPGTGEPAAARSLRRVNHWAGPSRPPPAPPFLTSR